MIVKDEEFQAGQDVSKYQEYVHIYGIAEKSQQQKIEELQAGQDVIKHQEHIHSYKIAEKSLKQKSKICRLAKMLSRIKSTYIAMRQQRDLHDRKSKS
jgi:NifU-like protein involved in Fe-S cluster formation